MGLCFAYENITLAKCEQLFAALGGDDMGAAVVPDADSECVYGYIERDDTE